MTRPRITLACRNLDGTTAIFRGQVALPGIELDAREENNPPKMFQSFFQGEYDVSEMSLAESVYYISRSKADFIGVPVFPSRVFRHSFLFCRPGSDVSPDSLRGRRFAFERWVQTAGVWQRGILVDELDVDPAGAEWHAVSLHHWHDEAEQPLQPRDGFSIRLLPPALAGDAHPYASMFAGLREDRLDVIGTTEGQSGSMTSLASSGEVRRVFPDYQEVEATYYQKTGNHPIMHVLMMRRSVAERYPELPAALFRMFCESKRIGLQLSQAVPSYALAWKHRWFEEEQAALKDDAWSHGLVRNQHTLATFLRYCYTQGVCDRVMEPKELFHLSTWDLVE